MLMAKAKPSALEKIHGAIDEVFPEHLERCRTFLRQKSISVTGEGIRETAAWLKDFIEALGGEASFWGNPSFPIVYGRLHGASQKTLIVYGMYDVQPAEERKWMSPPFAAEIYTLPGLGDAWWQGGRSIPKAPCAAFSMCSPP